MSITKLDKTSITFLGIEVFLFLWLLKEWKVDYDVILN